MDIEADIIRLKEKLSHYETKDLLGMIGNKLSTFGNNGSEVSYNANIRNKTTLHSPYKQYQYLAGLLLSTNCNDNNLKSIDDKSFGELEQDIERITFEYIKEISEPILKNAGNNNGFEISKASYTVLEEFDSYFNTGNLSYPEQIEQKIRIIFGGFNDFFVSKYNVTIDDMLSFYNCVYELTITSINNFSESLAKIQEAFQKNNGCSEKDLEEIGAKISSDIKIMDGLSKINIVNRNDLISHLGEKKITSLLRLFSSKRAASNYLYYTQDNIFANSPLVEVGEGEFFVTFPQFLIEAIYTFINNEVSADSKLTKKKGDSVEEYVLHLFKKIFSEKALFYKKVCEDYKTNEHDLLILYGKYIFIIEIKGSKVRAPLFNPEKSIVRIKDHFFGESGIGYGYNQAIKLKKKLESSKCVELYVNRDKKTEFLTCGKKVLPIVISLENFGKNQINMSNLIKPEVGQTYCWSCCVDDLDNMIEINNYLGKNVDDFIRYVRFRIKYHKQIFAGDELEILEEFYKNTLKIKGDCDLFIEPKGNSLIDKIYFEKNGIPYDYDFKK